MGCYDSVYAPCPECGKPSEFQSKSGPCCLSSYELKDAPADVLMDVNRHSPNRCECGALFAIEVEIKAIAKSVLVDTNE